MTTIRTRRKVMSIASALIFSTAAFIFVTACGDVFADPEGTDVPITKVEADASDTSAVFPDDTPPSCPAQRPRENTFCSAVGSICEFGKSADMECNGLLVCRGAPGDGYWEPRSSEACHASSCPVNADIASLDGKTCALAPSPFADAGAATDADEAVCNMTDGMCSCTTGRDAKSAHERRWVCVRPISVCPPNRPLAGTRCDGNLWCDYGSCAFKRGLLMECKGGVWLTGGAPCQ